MNITLPLLKWWLDVCPVSPPPRQKEKPFLSFVAWGTVGTLCLYEKLEAEHWAHVDREQRRRAWGWASSSRWFPGSHPGVVWTPDETLCPVALGPGFYIIGLFLEKQIRNWEWYYVRVKEAFHLKWKIHFRFMLSKKLFWTQAELVTPF